jgi:gamma-glutamylputrescine oxidase
MQIGPVDQLFWCLPQNKVNRLRGDKAVDVAVIGGGMAGLSAAYNLRAKGFSVVVLEKSYCGAGATGKSSGFITPDAELSLASLIAMYGAAQAHAIWQLIVTGVDQIRSTILTYQLSCDYSVQDTLVVATSKRAVANDIMTEHHARLQLGYQSSFYDAQSLPLVNTGQGYYAGVRYGDTFGIQGYLYCQQFKQVLQEQGIEIYEETPALSVAPHTITTPNGRIQAEKIVVCVDRYAEELGLLKAEQYHAQTFLMVSAPLSDQQIAAIFPDQPCMVWDTDLIYNYYRLTPDHRLLLGGSTLYATYAKKEKHDYRPVFQHLTRYWQKRFPAVQPGWHYLWPGLIGVSKDLFPIAGFCPSLPSVYLIAGAAGLPWAAALGRYCAQVIDGAPAAYDTYFSPERATLLGKCLPRLLGKRLTFALSHFLTVSSI